MPSFFDSMFGMQPPPAPQPQQQTSQAPAWGMPQGYNPMAMQNFMQTMANQGRPPQAGMPSMPNIPVTNTGMPNMGNAALMAMLANQGRGQQPSAPVGGPLSGSLLGGLYQAYQGQGPGAGGGMLGGLQNFAANNRGGGGLLGWGANQLNNAISPVGTMFRGM
jgi:hypothetical protein